MSSSRVEREAHHGEEHPHEPLALGGQQLTIGDVAAVARGGRQVGLAPAARRAMQASRQIIEQAVARGDAVYGVTTGFGELARTAVPPEQARRLQLNLVRSHAAGVGPPLPADVVRAIMLLRANGLALGRSGVRPEVVDLLIGCLNRGVLPVIPAQGSVGASGDLAPLAHLALVLIGEGYAQLDGAARLGGEALAARGLTPLTLEAKEGLALVNGTQVSAALAALALHDADAVLAAAAVAGAMSVEALRGSHGPFAEPLQAVRPQVGQGRIAAALRALLRDSEIEASHADCGRVQDPYTLRCIPQVLGASLDTFDHCRRVIEIELNAVTDNPLVFVEDEAIRSGGNFHAQPVALVADFLKIAAAEIAGFSERRTYLLLDAARSGLPAFLAPNPGLESGLMIAQNTAAALASENKVLAHPASVDSLPTSAGQEDHVSMAPIAARQAQQIVDNAARVVAIELLCAAQALDFLAPLRPGAGAAAAHTLVRRHVTTLTEDRPLSADIETLARLVREGAFRGLAGL